MTDLKPFDWISGYAHPSSPGLSSLIPDVLAHYARIPWTYGIMDHFPFDAYPAENGSIADLNRQHAIERELGIFFRKDIGHLYRETTLKELAERFGVAYCADTLSLIKSTPCSTALTDIFEQRIRQLLARLGGEHPLYLYAQDISRLIEPGDAWIESECHVLKNPDAYLDFQYDIAGWNSDTCVFGENRTWCLCTLESFPDLVFCYKDESDLRWATENGLEAFEVPYGFAL